MGIRKIRATNSGRVLALLLTVAAAACSGGGGGSAPMVQPATPQQAMVQAQLYTYQAPDTATLGANSAALATGTTSLGTMPLNTVLPLRQSIVSTNLGLFSSSGWEAGGATLTYKGTQTVNGVTGPVFDLSVPAGGINQTLLPDGTGGPCCGFNDVNGKALSKLNYTLTGTWNAVVDGTVCVVCTSMFVTGFQTPSANVPASGQATYLGNGASGSVSGNVYTGGSATLAATISGSSSSFSVNFGTGQVTGALSGLTATPVSTGGVAGAPQAWNQINITGSLSGAVLSGNTSTPSQPAGTLGLSANSTGTIGGALFGPNAEELGAVWSLQDIAGFKTALGVVSATKQ